MLREHVKAERERGVPQPERTWSTYLARKVDFLAFRKLQDSASVCMRVLTDIREEADGRRRVQAVPGTTCPALSSPARAEVSDDAIVPVCLSEGANLQTCNRLATCNPAPAVLHPTPYTLHPTPYTLSTPCGEMLLCRIIGRSAVWCRPGSRLGCRAG